MQKICYNEAGGKSVRYIKVDIQDISFEKKAYTQSLYDSVMRIGFSFPIQVYKDDKYYYCVDGHKRLSVLQDILKADPHYKRGSQVLVLVKDGINNRSSDCWRKRNSH